MLSCKRLPPTALRAVPPPDKREGDPTESFGSITSLPLVGRGDQAKPGGWEPHAPALSP